MKRTILFFILLLSLAAHAQPKHEVRAVWLTTIGGIDWPSSFAHDSKSIEAQKQELCRILDNLKAIHVNTVLLQTRIRATTIYPSDIEPWDGCLSGKPGLSPGYDALQYAIDQCHRRGMELHAWMVTIPVGKWTSYGCKQLRRHHPKMMKRIGEEGFLNPESDQTASYLAALCREVTSRYDIDGIHLDYIRYPETWKGSKNRQHITHIVECIHDSVKALKPWVKMSCSPIGKFDDLARYRSNGWNAYSRVAQDAQGWLRQGLMDQLYPMMYFKENNFYPFAIDWQEQSSGRTIVSGLGIYMLHPQERNWPLSEVRRQLEVTRQIGLGHCYFRAKFLLSNVKGIYDYVKTFDRHPALTPPMTWANNGTVIPPSAPTGLHIERSKEGDDLSWLPAENHNDSPYLLYNVYASTTEPVDVTSAANLVAVRCTKTELSIKRSDKSPLLHYAVTAVDRYGNESLPIQSTKQKVPTAVVKPLLFIQHDGSRLQVPDRNLFDARKLIVCDMHGREVMSCPDSPSIDISQLPNGVYVLRSQHRKGYQHRLGYFIIKREKNHGENHIRH